MASLSFTVGLVKWPRYYSFGALVNTLAFTSTNLVSSRLTDHGAEEHKRHDVALGKLQRAREEWNRGPMKRLDFMNKRLREKNEAKGIHQQL